MTNKSVFADDGSVMMWSDFAGNMQRSKEWESNASTSKARLSAGVLFIFDDMPPSSPGRFNKIEEGFRERQWRSMFVLNEHMMENKGNHLELTSSAMRKQLFLAFPSADELNKWSAKLQLYCSRTFDDMYQMVDEYGKSGLWAESIEGQARKYRVVRFPAGFGEWPEQSARYVLVMVSVAHSNVVRAEMVFRSLGDILVFLPESPAGETKATRTLRERIQDERRFVEPVIRDFAKKMLDAMVYLNKIGVDCGKYLEADNVIFPCEGDSTIRQTTLLNPMIVLPSVHSYAAEPRRHDVHACGRIMYEMMAGEPFSNISDQLGHTGSDETGGMGWFDPHLTKRRLVVTKLKRDEILHVSSDLEDFTIDLLQIGDFCSPKAAADKRKLSAEEALKLEWFTKQQ